MKPSNDFMNRPEYVSIDDDGTLYYEPYTHTYVRCRPVDFLRAKYELNHAYAVHGQRACLDDFLKWLHIDESGIGHSLGWEWVGEWGGLDWIDISDDYMSDECRLIVYIFEPQLLYPPRVDVEDDLERIRNKND